MGSSKMAPFALVTTMRVLSFDGYYNVTVTGCDETFSLPSKATNESWPQYKKICKGVLRADLLIISALRAD